MAIFFCGDTHGRFGHVIEAVQRHRPQALVFLGDLQPKKPLEQVLAPVLDLVEVWFIHGNHDSDSDACYDNLFASSLRDRNLHGRVVEIAGLRIAGLGGVFRGRVWWPTGERRFESPQEYCCLCEPHELWRASLPRRHRTSIFPCDYDALSQQRADILVTHEAPACHPRGFTAIDDLAHRLGVTKSFHGHHHDWPDYRQKWQKLGFEVFGVGLCGIVDGNGDIIYRDDAQPLKDRNRKK